MGDIEGVWYDFCTEILTYDVPFKAFLIEFEVKLIDNEQSLMQYEQLLKDLNYKYEVFLNRPRNKCLSEMIVLRVDNEKVFDWWLPNSDKHIAEKLEEQSPVNRGYDYQTQQRDYALSFSLKYASRSKVAIDIGGHGVN